MIDQTQELGYRALLGEYAAAFWNLFGHAQREAWAERTAAEGITRRSLNVLYPVEYDDVDARITAIARLDPDRIEALYKIQQASGSTISLLAAFADISLEDIGGSFKDGYYVDCYTRAEQMLRDAHFYAESTPWRQLLAVERSLGRLIWAFANPDAFDLGQQRYLIVALSDLVGALPQSWAISAPVLTGSGLPVVKVIAGEQVFAVRRC